MAKREFLMLAHKYKNEPIGGWYMSHKLDGMRAMWDGGVTRGMALKDVPFSNTEKDSRYITQPIATGLWSRYGKSIQAPDWWLDLLPNIPLDGELYMGLNSFQRLMSTAKKMTPGSEWNEIEYKVFDIPPLRVAFGDGEMDNINFKKKFSNVLGKLGIPAQPQKPLDLRFFSIVSYLQGITQNAVFKVHEQKELPYSTLAALEVIECELAKVVATGGEGLMLRHPYSFWSPQRTRQLLKVKDVNDDEGMVIGYIAGRETDKGSKLLGLMGALILSYKGKVFELSGFTEAERVLNTYGTIFATANPGEKLPEGSYSDLFPIGSKICFKYRELTDDGLPKEARYFRKLET